MAVAFNLKNIASNIPPAVKKFDPSYVTRYVIVSELVKQAEKHLGRKAKILDLGGYNGAARDLLPGRKITIVDVMDDDELEDYVKTNGSVLPFKDGEFDIVISCDTLEHVLPKERDTFIKEMVRVSSGYCFLGAPFGTQSVTEAELNADIYYQGMTGESYIWLKEHREYGLPKKEWLAKLLDKSGVEHTTFGHTSLELWGVMLRHSFFLANNIKAVVPSIGERLLKENDTYFDDFTFHDFPPEGYRTFYVVSKQGKPEVQLPPYSNEATQKFLNRQYELAGNCMQELTKQYGVLQSELEAERQRGQEVYEDSKNNLAELHQAREQAKQVQGQLDTIRNSAAYRAARKLAHAKRKLTGNGN